MRRVTARDLPLFPNLELKMTRLRTLAFGLITLTIVWAVLDRGAAAAQSPSLLGTWHATFKMETRSGVTTTKGKLVVTYQDEHLFRATFSWSIDPTTGVRADVNRRVGQEGTEDVLGVFHWDNRTIWMSDAGDKGYWSGALVGKDTLRLIYLEPQRHATVFRAIFVRETQPQPAD